MAEAAGQLPLHGALSWLRRPSPAACYGIKFGAAVSASLWLGYASGLPQPTWAMITVAVICLPTAGGSIQKGLLRLLGTVLGSFFAVAIFGAFAQEPPFLLASVAAIYALAAYGMSGPRYAYAWNVFGITAGIILLDGLTGVDQIENLAFQRAALVCLAIVVVAVADAIFWPMGAEDALRRTLSGRIRQLRAGLSQAIDEVLGTPGRAATPPTAPASPLTQEMELVDQLGMEVGASRTRTKTFGRVALLVEGLVSRVRLLGRTAQEQGVAAPTSVRDALARLASELDAALADIDAALTGAMPATGGSKLEDAAAAFEAARMAELDSLARGAREVSDEERAAATRVSAASSILRDVARALRALQETLMALNASDGPADAGRPAASASTQSGSGIWRVDALRLESALRAGIAGAAGLVVMMVLGWPPSSLVPTIAFVAATGPTRAAAMLVVVLVAIGALASWVISDLSIVFLFTHIDRMPVSLLYPFVLAGGLAYLAVAKPPLAPLTGLVSVMAILSVFGGPAPPTGVSGPYDVTVLILLGLGVGLVVQRLLWPRTAASLFLERAASLVELGGKALAPVGSADERSRATARLVGEYGRQIALLGPLHKQAHLESPQHGLDDPLRAALLVRIQDLFDAALLASGARAGSPSAAPSHPDSGATDLLSSLVARDVAVDESLGRVARALRSPDPGSESFPAQSDLERADAAVRESRTGLRNRGTPVDLDLREADARLARLDAGDRLAACQLTLEDWLRDWLRAARASAPEHATPPSP